jgi:hypothetical protein
MEIIASYLPQYFPIPENNLWHEPGFTEWTNVTKAKPLYPGHYQPKIPGELGFYDLRVPEVKEFQVELAKKYGVTSFCFWHYWFGNGEKILNFQVEEMLRTNCPKFPFCLGWANESWYGIDHGVKNRLLLEQKYPSYQDYIDHFNYCLKAFKDDRYTKIDGKPLFLIYKPKNLPNPKEFIDLWQILAKENGLDGIFFVAQTQFENQIDDLIIEGFDAVNTVRLRDVSVSLFGFFVKSFSKIFRVPQIYSYKMASKYFIQEAEYREDVIPTIIPNWDHTPRTGKRGTIFHNSSPLQFEKVTKKAVSAVQNKKNKIIFVKSWNEWGEGNYLEPDRKFKRGFLESLAKGLTQE